MIRKCGHLEVNIWSLNPIKSVDIFGFEYDYGCEHYLMIMSLLFDMCLRNKDKEWMRMKVINEQKSNEYHWMNLFNQHFKY